jgi:antitoxin ParD1/3/4
MPIFQPATMNVSLTPELEKLVQSKVQSGRYQSASEVIREGLRLLDDQDRRRSAELDEVRRKIQTGLDQLNRGEGVSGAKVLSELKKRARRCERRGNGDDFWLAPATRDDLVEIYELNRWRLHTPDQKNPDTPVGASPPSGNARSQHARKRSVFPG